MRRKRSFFLFSVYPFYYIISLIPFIEFVLTIFVFFRQQRLISTKETAFSKAIIAAGIAHSITKNCSQGQIEGCKCQNTDKFPIDQQLKYKNHQEKIKTLSGDVRIKKEVTENVTKGVNNDKNVEWRWGGCSDNPMFASQITEKIIDSMETGIDVPAYISRHNAKVGIKVIILLLNPCQS